MPEPETPKSFDATASEPADRLEAFRRSPGFRYAAIAICGIGLATAGSTFLRLGQGWRQPAPEVATGSGDTGGPRIVAAAPDRPAPARQPVPMPAAPPSLPQVAPIAPAGGTEVIPARPLPPETASAPAPQQAPPSQVVDAQSAPQAAAPTGASPSPPPASVPSRDPVRDLAQAPPPQPVEPAGAPTIAGAGAPASTRPGALPPSGAPRVAQEQGQGEERSKQDGRAEPSREKPRPEERRRRRYARPSEPQGPSQFRAAPAPAGSAANVRAYSFASNGGRVIDGAGTRIQVIRVR